MKPMPRKATSVPSRQEKPPRTGSGKGEEDAERHPCMEISGREGWAKNNIGILLFGVSPF
jgi:hypothetical protein